MFAKWEDCPQCSCVDKRWHYDAQVCHKCGYPNKDENGFSVGKIHPFNAVKEFHQKFNHPIAQEIINLDDPDEAKQKLIELRLDLLTEEYNEFQDAFMDNNEIEMLDGLCDMIYVIYGLALCFGWDINAAFAEIHRSNMSKLGEDGKPIVREDGKILKGPNYSPPRLGQFFARKK